MSFDLQYKNSDLAVFNNKVISLSVRRDNDVNASLVLRSNNQPADTVIYTSDKNIVDDFQVVGENSNVRVAWRERDNRLFAESEFHYAEITSEGKLVGHHILSCDNENCRHTSLLRAKVVAGYLVLAVISEKTKKMILVVYDGNDYSQRTSTLSLDDRVNEKYLTSQKILQANVVLLPVSDNSMYLQFLLSSGTLRNYNISINEESGAIESSKLFDFALDNIGYHNSLIDSEQKLILITYSGTALEDNGIYAVKQTIFSRESVCSGKSVKVSQTTGDYFRPFVIRQDDGYLIAWEGENIHYTVIDSELDIIMAETTRSAISPGHVLLTEYGGVFLSCQTEFLLGREFGSSLLLTELFNVTATGYSAGSGCSARSFSAGGCAGRVLSAG